MNTRDRFNLAEKQFDADDKNAYVNFQACIAEWKRQENLSDDDLYSLGCALRECAFIQLRQGMLPDAANHFLDLWAFLQKSTFKQQHILRRAMLLAAVESIHAQLKSACEELLAQDGIPDFVIKDVNAILNNLTRLEPILAAQSVSASPPKKPVSNIEERFGIANSKFLKGKHDEAYVLFNEVIKELQNKERNAEENCSLACSQRNCLYILLEKKQFEDAYAFYRQLNQTLNEIGDNIEPFWQHEILFDACKNVNVFMQTKFKIVSVLDDSTKQFAQQALCALEQDLAVLREREESVRKKADCGGYRSPPGMDSYKNNQVIIDFLVFDVDVRLSVLRENLWTELDWLNLRGLPGRKYGVDFTESLENALRNYLELGQLLKTLSTDDQERERVKMTIYAYDHLKPELTQCCQRLLSSDEPKVATQAQRVLQHLQAPNDRAEKNSQERKSVAANVTLFNPTRQRKEPHPALQSHFPTGRAFSSP